MRTSNALVSLSVLLLAAGGIASGCISNTVTPPPSVDSGLPSFDSGALGDGAPPTDATIGTTGDGSAATLTTTPIDFGLVGCGTGSASQTYSFTNTGSGPINYSASVASGSVFSITAGSSGIVTAGATGSITLAVSAIPTTTVAGTALTSTLKLTTNVPALAAVNVPLTVTAAGGALTVTPALAGFGQVQIGSSGTAIPLQITNSGNAPVTVTFGAPTELDGGAVDPEFGLFYAGSPGGTTIVAKGTAGAGATFTPTAPGTRSVALAIQTNDPLCASPATAVAMSGTGTTAQVAVGPNPLQFGSVPCGQTGASLQVTLTNTSPGSVTFTDALGLGAASPFTIDVTAGTVTGGSCDAGTTVINVTPKAIPVPGNIAAGAYDDTLVVTPNAPFVSPTTIALEESASGAILVLTMGGDGGTDFGTISSGQNVSLPFNVTNTGNVDAPLGVVVTGAGYSAAYTSAADAGADGGTATGNVSFDPTTSGPVAGSLTVSSTAPLCAIPASIALTAAGAIPVASFPTTPIAVGAICGGGATTQGSVTITNTGGSPLAITGAASTSATFIIVSAPTVPIPVGQTGTITIQAASLGQGTLGGTTLADSLTFTTNETGNPTRSVAVGVAVSGANLSYVGGATASLDCSASYVVTNTGNMPATVQATGTYPVDGDSTGDQTVFEFDGTFSKGAVIAAGGQASDAIEPDDICSIETEACTLTGTQAFTSLNASGTTVGICVPLPVLSLSLAYCSCNDC